MQPTKFNSDKIVRTYLHPFIYAPAKLCISSTPRVSEVNRIATQTLERKKTTTTKQSLLSIKLNVFKRG